MDNEVGVWTAAAVKKRGVASFGMPRVSECEWCGRKFASPPSEFCNDICTGEVRRFLVWVLRSRIEWQSIAMYWRVYVTRT